jgi:ABC-2 type transport system permease protein
VTALTMLFAGMQAVTLPLVLDLGYTKEIEDRVLSPIGVHFIALEKMVMGTLHSILSGLLVLPLAKVILHGGVSLNLRQWELTIALAVLIGLVSSSLGLMIGSYIKPEKVGLMFSLIVAPIIFFGCTYYPWVALSQIPLMKKLVLLNPLVYMAEGLRAAITPAVPHMPLHWILTGLTVSLVLFTWLGLSGFYRRVID